VARKIGCEDEMWIELWIVFSARLYSKGGSAITEFVRIHQYIYMDILQELA
jgi:hypothetical protein